MSVFNGGVRWRWRLIRRTSDLIQNCMCVRRTGRGNVYTQGRQMLSVFEALITEAPWYATTHGRGRNSENMTIL